MIDFELSDHEGIITARLIGDHVLINDIQDAIDLLGNASYQQAEAVIVQEHQLSPDFFDLRSGLAGEILQKYANYGMKLAVIGSFEKYQSKALNAFIIECNRGKHIFFVPNKDDALRKFSGN